MWRRCANAPAHSKTRIRSSRDIAERGPRHEDLCLLLSRCALPTASCARRGGAAADKRAISVDKGTMILVADVFIMVADSYSLFCSADESAGHEGTAAAHIGHGVNHVTRRREIHSRLQARRSVGNSLEGALTFLVCVVAQGSDFKRKFCPHSRNAKFHTHTHQRVRSS